MVRKQAKQPQIQRNVMHKAIEENRVLLQYGNWQKWQFTESFHLNPARSLQLKERQHFMPAFSKHPG